MMSGKTMVMVVATAFASSLLTIGLVRLWSPEPTVHIHEAATPQYSVHQESNPVARDRPLPVSFREAARKSADAVTFVSALHIERPQAWNPKEYSYSTGSGIVVSADGYILTNEHVVRSSKNIKVTLNNKLEYEAKIVGSDAGLDIALLKIDATSLPYLSLDSSGSAQLGDWVLAVGNPFKLQSTVTAGIVSATHRYLRSDASLSPHYIQTDAIVNAGNSGGALVDTEGRLVGLITAIISESGLYEGYSFALPVDIVAKAFEDFRLHGSIQLPTLGISVQEHNSESPKGTGLFITKVTAPASKVDLRIGDRLLSVDGWVTSADQDLKSFLLTKSPGDTVQVRTSRGEKIHSSQIVLKRRKARTQGYEEAMF